MDARSLKGILAGCALAAGLAQGQPFGRVTAIGGHAADLALDEAREVVYVANFTANRIDVVSARTGELERSIQVASQPASVAVSPGGRYLVAGHYGHFADPFAARNALTVIDLETRARQTYALADPPLGVAFGADGYALVVTSRQFIRFEPWLGTMEVLDTISGVVARTLPQPPAEVPAEIVAASVQASGDGRRIFGVTDTLLFVYDVAARHVQSGGYAANPPLGPRTISAAWHGEYYLAGWAMFDGRGMVAQFPNPSGRLERGSHAIDSRRGVIYAQVPEREAAAAGRHGGGQSAPSAGPPPVLQILDAGNLRVRERLRLAEDLSGKSVLNSDGTVMYSLSLSGLTALPVGALHESPRLAAGAEDLVFRSSFCGRGRFSRELAITDPGGGRTRFQLRSSHPGIEIRPRTGVTPATVVVSVDTAELLNRQGTLAAEITIHSDTAVNLARPVRVLVQMQEPEQRGFPVNVPGRLVDLLADPARNRFFILRQDTNEVLVFDAADYRQIGALSTGNTPVSMAFTFDRRFLLVGNDNSQYANVYDLETLEATAPIRFPSGHYPRWLAASGRALLAATRGAGGVHKIGAVNFHARTAVELPTLGAFANDIHENTALAATANGGSILAAMADGTLMLYNANADTFTVARKDHESLSGAVAASNFDQFVVGDRLFNASLVQVRQYGTAAGSTSGFVFLDAGGFRTWSPAGEDPGVIERLANLSGAGTRATRMAESPLVGAPGAVFTRTLAVTADRRALISLSTSGFTVLSWDYDAAARMPRIDRVVNAADGTRPVAPGGLIVIHGQDLSPVTAASREMPLPVALGETCLTVNGVSAPMLMASPARINAQLPFQAEGNVTLLLRTPGGSSDAFYMTVLPHAPSVFRRLLADEYEAPAVVRAANGQVVTPSNPVRGNDTLLIYLTGMGRTLPEVAAGQPAPSEPAAEVLTRPLVDLAGTPLPVLHSRLTAGEVGVYEIVVEVPHTVARGLNRILRVSQGGFSTEIPVRVVD
jgi:uncharacterized protein (TIGR03437 family)